MYNYYKFLNILIELKYFNFFFPPLHAYNKEKCNFTEINIYKIAKESRFTSARE